MQKENIYKRIIILKFKGLPVVFWAICSLWLSSCSPKVADVDIPYDTLQEFSLSGVAEVQDEWWREFQDDTLNILIDSALQVNLPLITAWYQIEEAGALVEIVSSEKWPEVFLQLQSGFSIPEPDFVGGELTQLSLRSNYEVDLWGRIRYSAHAQEYRFRATYFDYKTAAVSLSGELTLTWFRMKALRQQMALLDEQISTNEQVLALIRARFAGGQVRGVDILRQEQLIENTREQKIELEAQIGVLKNQLYILLGKQPGDAIPLTAKLPELPPLPDTGIPLELVNRRPDVQSAFFRLQASDRELAAAISSKYPRLSFSLNTAIRSNSIEGLFESQALSVSSSLLMPLFYGGRLNAEVDRAESFRQQMANEYGHTVLLAFQEVENALIREVKTKEQITALERQVELAEKTFGQLRVEYLNGSIPYLDVLVTLGQQQQLRRELVEAHLSLLEIRVALYRALAGGFETERERQQNEG